MSFSKITKFHDVLKEVKRYRFMQGGLYLNATLRIERFIEENNLDDNEFFDIEEVADPYRKFRKSLKYIREIKSEMSDVSDNMEKTNYPDLDDIVDNCKNIYDECKRTLNEFYEACDNYNHK